MGLLPAGGSYVVQAFVGGEPVRAVDDETVRALLPVFELQADLRPEIDQDWSRYATDVVFHNESGFAAALRQFSADTAAVVRCAEALTAGLRGIELPTDDLVHGNFDIGNFHLEDGEVVGVVDVMSIGKGTRVYDIAALFTQGFLWDGTPTALERLRKRGMEITEPGAFTVSVAASVFGVMWFGTQHWPKNADVVARRARSLLDSLSNG
jgi:hypothetical protein